jgi:hypothetical protein
MPHCEPSKLMRSFAVTVSKVGVLRQMNEAA